MKIKQQVTREGGDIILRLHQEPGGKLLATRVWKDLAKYLDPRSSTADRLVLVIPTAAGLNIKPGS